jgi:NAD(P)-dependent dehydrogenase (short-subunit alcohol dehydrogenase family)
VVAGDLQAPQIDAVLGVEVDVADEEAVDRAFGRIEAELATVDLLVLNAGIFVIEPFEETTLASWRRTLDVNLTGAFLCARRALPAMRERGFGRLVAIGSSAGKTGGAKSIAAYGASKAGIMAMAKSIASEYAGTGVTANALAPALIDTDMVAAMPDMRERIPLGRFGTTQEVADVVAFLCSDHSSFITGEVVDVNGGFLID